MGIDLGTANTLIYMKEKGIILNQPSCIAYDKNLREIIAVSNTGAKVFNREAAYVAATRAKDNTEVITTDREAMLRNAGKDVKKTTASDIGRQEGVLAQRDSQLGKAVLEAARVQKPATQDRGLDKSKVEVSKEKSAGREMGF